MKSSIFSRSIAIFFLYTLILIGVLYLIQRYLAPTIYYDSIIDDYQEMSDTIIDRFESEDLNRSDFEAIDQETIPSLSVFNAQGIQIYSENESDLTPFQTVEVFQNAPFDRLVQENDQFYIEYFDTSEGTIFRIKSPINPYTTNFNALNQLFLILFMSALGLMIPLSYIFARTFSKPVVRLSVLATKLSKLDFAFTSDVTRKDELGDLEKTLKEMAKALKDTIEQLKIELKKEKELEKLQKQFVARVSHEIRTPLSVIKASVESLLSQVKTPLNFDYETMINEEIDHLVHLTDDLIDLAQLESGRFSIQKESIDIFKIINKVSYLLSIKHNRPIRNELKGEFIIKGDEKRLTQVFYNLLSNAFIHSDIDGPIKISLNQTELMLTNHKKTIAKEEVKYLSRSFYKSKENKEGYGLGLAITEAILIKHDIALTLLSENDQFIARLDFSKAI